MEKLFSGSTHNQTSISQVLTEMLLEKSDSVPKVSFLRWGTTTSARVEEGNAKPHTVPQMLQTHGQVDGQCISELPASVKASRAEGDLCRQNMLFRPSPKATFDHPLWLGTQAMLSHGLLGAPLRQLPGWPGWNHKQRLRTHARLCGLSERRRACRRRWRRWWRSRGWLLLRRRWLCGRLWRRPCWWTAGRAYHTGLAVCFNADVAAVVPGKLHQRHLLCPQGRCGLVTRTLVAAGLRC
mmetsp:Transcript_85307/g.204359  ORF Transcript_85307/g.204359 Transcript_85307/m.204359 type:complete len:239 (+) Transcript_85307:1625-2341(+)